MINQYREHIFIGLAALSALLLPLHAAEAQPVSKVMLGEARYKELPATSLFVGSVRPNRVSLIGAEVEGLVQDLPVRQGDFVRKGDLICKLVDDILQLELQAAGNKLESLKAAEQVTGADLQRWQLEKQRVESLEQSKRANAKEVYDTLADFLMAQNRVREAKQDVAEQQTLVELKQTEIAKTKILAPFDGYVTELHSEVGQWMPRGGQVVEMIDIETVLVRVDVPESAISHVRVGDDARIVLDALECAFEGRVKYVIPRAHEQARTFPVDIEVVNPEHKLHSGLFARCTVKTGPAGQAISVPKDAVVQQKGASRIWMVQEAGPQGAMAIPMHVTLGAEVSDVDGEWVAVTSGNVLPGMKVVVRGNEQLMPFPSPVVVVQEEALISTGTAPAISDQRGAEHVDRADTTTEERSGSR